MVTNAIRDKFRNLNILVIGDIILDRYIYGTPKRLSPEAPVPVLQHTETKEAPGGAANVAMNVAGLGAHVTIWTLSNLDFAYLRLKDLAHPVTFERDLNNGFPTIVKTRVAFGQHHFVRIDEEDLSTRSYDVERVVLPVFGPYAAVIISDYNKGVVTNDLIDAIKVQAREWEIPVFADLKAHHLRSATGLAGLVVNEKELHKSFDNPPCCTLVTQGPLGMDFYQAESDKAEPVHIDTVAQQIYDVTGAGDTVLATFAVAMTAGMLPLAAAHLANAAAGKVVGRLGTSPITIEDLRKVGS